MHPKCAELHVKHSCRSLFLLAVCEIMGPRMADQLGGLHKSKHSMCPLQSLDGWISEGALGSISRRVQVLAPSSFIGIDLSGSLKGRWYNGSCMGHFTPNNKTGSMSEKPKNFHYVHLPNVGRMLTAYLPWENTRETTLFDRSNCSVCISMCI